MVQEGQAAIVQGALLPALVPGVGLNGLRLLPSSAQLIQATLLPRERAASVPDL